MRRTILTLALTAGALLFAGSKADAQVIQTGRYFNPWVGYPNYSTSYYNPYNGGYAVRNTYVNPYTGSNVYQQSYTNPWTGNYGTSSYRYNPYSNTYRYRVWNGNTGLYNGGYYGGFNPYLIYGY